MSFDRITKQIHTLEQILSDAPLAAGGDAWREQALSTLDSISHDIHQAKQNRQQESDRMAEIQDILNAYLRRDFDRKAPITGERLDLDALALSVNYYGEELQCAFADLEERNAQLSKANEEIRLLFREVHHRVKNNLQVITSLLRLQSRDVTDSDVKEAFLESQNRIHSMGVIHKMLYSNSMLSSIRLDDYLDELVSNLLYSYKQPGHSIRTEVDAKGIEVDLNYAIPLGLLVNEIVTNALKHGLDDQGLLYIHAEKIDHNHILLAIGNDGQGAISLDHEQRPGSIGQMLIQELTQQLDGDLNLSDETPGVHYRILLRIPETEELVHA